jgi:acylphosphatase
MDTQAHIFFRGVVQGVGFRFTVQRMARSFDLKGWAKNLPDGRVEVLVEGEDKCISKLIEKIQQYFQGHIKDVQVNYKAALNGYTTFEIQY